MLIDTHCHLNDEAFLNEEEDYLFRAQQVGVGAFFVVGWDVESSRRAVELAHLYPQVYAIVGIHPENLEGVNETDLQAIDSLAADPLVVAIGEIGLDYHWTNEEDARQRQEIYFIRQIELANRHQKPISIHSRDAMEKTLEILQAHLPIKGGVMHCYSGSSEMAPSFIKLGMYISLGGPVTFKNARVPKEVASTVPLTSLLTETDAPYLAPTPYRGQRNESAYIINVVNEIAALRHISREQLEEAVQTNTENLFHVKLNA